MASVGTIKKDGFIALAQRVRKLEIEDVFPELEPDMLEEGKYSLNGTPLTEAAIARYSRAKEQMAERLDKLGE